MLGLKLGFGQRAGQARPMAAEGAPLKATDSIRVQPTLPVAPAPLAAPSAIAATVPTLRPGRPGEQAELLLAWLTGIGGRTGTLTYDEMHEAHGEMCREHGLEVCSWPAVSRRFRELTGQRKEYGRRDGRSVVLYRVEPAASARAGQRPALQVVASGQSRAAR